MLDKENCEDHSNNIPVLASFKTAFASKWRDLCETVLQNRSSLQQGWWSDLLAIRVLSRIFSASSSVCWLQFWPVVIRLGSLSGLVINLNCLSCCFLQSRISVKQCDQGLHLHVPGGGLGPLGLVAHLTVCFLDK